MEDVLVKPGRLELVDLSVSLENAAVSELLSASIHYVQHAKASLAQMQQFFGIVSEDLVYSEGQGWAIEKITHR